MGHRRGHGGEGEVDVSRGVLRRLSFACWRFLRLLSSLREDNSNRNDPHSRAAEAGDRHQEWTRRGAHRVAVSHCQSHHRRRDRWSWRSVVHAALERGGSVLGEAFHRRSDRAADRRRGSARHRTAHQKDQLPGRAESVHQGGGGDGVVGHSWQVAEHAGLSAAGRRGARVRADEVVGVGPAPGESSRNRALGDGTGVHKNEGKSGNQPG